MNIRSTVLAFTTAALFIASAAVPSFAQGGAPWQSPDLTTNSFSPKLLAQQLWSEGYTGAPYLTLGSSAITNPASLLNTQDVAIKTVSLGGVPYTDVKFQSGTSKTFSLRLKAGETIILHAATGSFGGLGTSTTFYFSGLTNATELTVNVTSGQHDQSL